MIIKSFLFVIVLISFVHEKIEASVLSEAANSLAPGESMRLVTTLTGDVLNPPGDHGDFIQWGSSGVWDPVRFEVRFVGKKHDPGDSPFHVLAYDVATNKWTNDREPPVPLGSWGHGYDHNTVEPTTGDHYYRQYNSNRIYKWDGKWDEYTTMPQNFSVAASISWFDGLGLVYVDRGVVQYFNGSNWTIVTNNPPNFGLHNISEFNSQSKVLLYGGGSDAPTLLNRMDASGSINSAAEAPFSLGSSPSAGMLVSDPSSASLIAVSRSSWQWAEYDIEGNKWSNLYISTGDGSQPEHGTPNLARNSTGQSLIAIPINTFGVIMFIQDRGTGSTPVDVWLYRHSIGNRGQVPLPPTIRN